MQDMPLPECLGTVVVHQYDAVTCTRDTCPRDMNLETWFSHHTSFTTCTGKDCPHCGFSTRLRNGYDNPAPSAFSRRRGLLLKPEFGRRGSSS